MAEELKRIYEVRRYTKTTGNTQHVAFFEKEEDALNFVRKRDAYAGASTFVVKHWLRTGPYNADAEWDLVAKGLPESVLTSPEDRLLPEPEPERQKVLAEMKMKPKALLAEEGHEVPGACVD